MMLREICHRQSNTTNYQKVGIYGLTKQIQDRLRLARLAFIMAMDGIKHHHKAVAGYSAQN